MHVVALPAFNDNYIWIIESEQACIVVDPGDAAPVANYLKDNHKTLAAILLTHHHADHIGGVHALLEDYPSCPVYGPATARFSDLITVPCREHDIITINDPQIVLNVMELTGHTKDHIGFFAPEKNWVFVGDTLFSMGCGRLFEGTADQMYHSLTRIMALPATSQIFCTHEYTLANCQFAQVVLPADSVIAQYKQHVAELRNEQRMTLPVQLSEEMQRNPFLRVHEPVLQHAIAKHFNLILPLTPELTFAYLRRWKDEY